MWLMAWSASHHLSIIVTRIISYIQRIKNFILVWHLDNEQMWKPSSRVYIVQNKYYFVESCLSSVEWKKFSYLGSGPMIRTNINGLLHTSSIIYVMSCPLKNKQQYTSV